MSQPRFILRNVSDGSETEITKPMIVGRQADCALVLPGGGPEGGVSRRHAELSLNGGAVWLEDLKSLNGTYVNDARLTTKTRLQSGDRVRFDVIEFEFQDLGDPADQATVFRGVQSAPPPPHRPESAAAPPPPHRPEPAAAPPPRTAAGETPQAPPRQSSAAEPAAARQANQGPRWIDPDALNEGNTQLYRVDSASPHSPNKPAEWTPLDVDVPTLVVISGAKAGQRIKLRATDASGNDAHQWTIGSDSDRNIVFDEVGVSGRHARIVNEGQRWKIINELAKNGTFVDGKRSNASYLASGSELRFGSVTCVFELPKRGAAAVERVVERAVGRKLPMWAIALIVSFVVTGALIVAWSHWR